MRMKLLSFALTAAMLISCGSCAAAAGADEVLITLSDSGITVDGKTASTDSSSAVYTGNDIIYYEDGTDSSYGEGTAGEMHSASEAAAHTVVDGEPMAIDVGSFCGDRWFTYVAGFGAFTDVPYETPQEEKRMLGRLAYLLKGAKSLGGIKPIPMRMTVNGQVIEDEVLLGLVCSTTSVGGFRPKSLAAGVSLNDGLSEVIVVKNIRSIQDLNAIGILLTRQEFDPSFFYTYQTDHVEFDFQTPVKWTLDGEFGGAHRHTDIRNLHQAVQILVPQG